MAMENYLYTPYKNRMEPKNHPVEKEHHLKQTLILRFNMLFLQGVISRCFKKVKSGHQKNRVNFREQFASGRHFNGGQPY